MSAKYLALSPRDRHEHHRVATPLELLYDLASVVAIAAAAHGLGHAISANHVADGVIGFAFSFFAIWWAWMNYTWFASAYDSGRPLFRIVTMIIIFGALMMAAGITALFEQKPFFLVWLGFVVMRLGQLTLWLMAAQGDPDHRTAAQRYAAGIAAAQLYWTFLFFALTPGTGLFRAAFVLGMAFELAVPVYAEAAGNTTWHRHHIIERYALLNIIVLGEVLLSTVNALRRTGEAINLANPLLHVAISAAVITFALWWAYFTREDHLPIHDHRRAFLWGYGHVIIYGSGAALGAGFSVLIEVLTKQAAVDLRTGDIAIAIPLALYLGGLWFVRDRFLEAGVTRHTLLIGAAAILVAGLFLPAALELMALLTVLTVFLRTR
jgi:low temperature requirement protein LtrA